MHVNCLVGFFSDRAREADYLLLLEIVGVTDRASGVGNGFYRIFRIEMGELNVLLAFTEVLDHFELDLHLPIIRRT